MKTKTTRLIINFSVIFSAWTTWLIATGDASTRDDVTSVATTGCAVTVQYSSSSEVVQVTANGNQLLPAEGGATLTLESTTSLPPSTSKLSSSGEVLTSINTLSDSAEKRNDTSSSLSTGKAIKDFTTNEDVQRKVSSTPSNDERSASVVLPNSSLAKAPRTETIASDFTMLNYEHGTMSTRSAAHDNRESSMADVTGYTKESGAPLTSESEAFFPPSTSKLLSSSSVLTSTGMLSDIAAVTQSTKISDEGQSAAGHAANESNATAPMSQDRDDVSTIQVEVTAIVGKSVSSISEGETVKGWSERSDSQFTLEHNGSTAALLLPLTSAAQTLNDEGTSGPWNQSFNNISTMKDIYDTAIYTQSTLSQVSTQEITSRVSVNESSSASELGSTFVFHSTEKRKRTCEPPGALSILEKGNVLFLSWDQNGSCVDTSNFITDIHLNGQSAIYNCTIASNITGTQPSQAFVNCLMQRAIAPGELLEITVFVGDKSDNVSRSESYLKQPARPENLTVSRADGKLCLTWKQDGFYDNVFTVDISLSSDNSTFTTFDNVTGSKMNDSEEMKACLNFSRGFCPASRHRVRLVAKRREKHSESSTISFESDPTPPLMKCRRQGNLSFLLELKFNYSENCSRSINQSDHNFTYHYSVTNSRQNKTGNITTSPGSLTWLSPVTVDEAGVTYEVKGWTAVESEYNILHCTTVPNPPASVNVSRVTSTAAYLSWSQPDGHADEYTYYCRRNISCSHECPVEYIDRTKSLNGTCSNLLPGADYIVTVISHLEDDNVSSAESSPVPFLTEPAVPQNLSVSDAGERLCLSWSQQGLYDSFQMNVLLSVNQTTSDNITANMTTPSNLTDACFNFGFGVCSASKHDLQLRAKRREKWSHLSNISFDSDPKPPLMECGDQSNSSFVLNMKLNDSSYCFNHMNLSGNKFTYYYSVVNSTEIEIKTDDIAISFEDPVSLPNVIVNKAGVTYKVKGWTGVNGVRSKNYTSLECTTVPNPPSTVCVSKVNATAAYLDWSQPEGHAVEYTYCCRRLDDHDHDKWCSNRTQGLNGTCLNLFSGGTYSVSVSSHLEETKNISSSESSPVFFLTEPLPPENVTFMNSTNGTATLHIECNNNSKCAYFNVTYGVHGAEFERCVNSPKNHLCNLSKLESNRDYNVTVYSVSNGSGVGEKRSLESKNISFWTRPDMVSSMDISSTHNSLKVNWICLRKEYGHITYKIEICNSSGHGSQGKVELSVCTVNNGSGSHEFTGLTSSTNYTITLRAVNEGGDGEALERTAVTLAEPYDIMKFFMIVGYASAPSALFLLIIALIYAVSRRQKEVVTDSPSKKTRGLLECLNPAFSSAPDMSKRAKPDLIPFNDFVSRIDELHNDSDFRFSSEYTLLQEMSPKFPQTVAEMESNRIKNRYCNILPYDHSRVKLIPLDDDDECSDYINANYMPGFSSKREFIAAQGPMKSTIEDFWRMLWEQQVTTVVMVTNLQENGREKCAEYWPSEREPIFYGDIQVQMISESQLNYYIIRILEVKMGERKRMLKHLHFIAWPDFGCPENTAVLLDFVTGVRSHMSNPSSQNSGSGPILVHCSAGVGRTGTFILVDRLLQHIRSRGMIDIFGVVLEMRHYRCNMIQTEAQYVFAYECIKQAIQRQLESNCIEEVDEHEEETVYQNVTSKGVGVPREELLYQNLNQKTDTVVEMETAIN